MTKKERIELVQSRLTGIYTDEDLDRFDERIIEKNISNIYNQIIIELHSKNLIALDSFSKVYTDVDVLGTSGSYYSIIPEKLVPLTNFQDGIVEIYGGQIFVPISINQKNIISGLEVSQIITAITYSLGIKSTGDHIVEYNNMVTANHVSTVNMRLVIPFESYDDNDEVRIPGGQDEKLMEIIINLLANTPKKDLKNNNSDIKD